jgi:fluoride ion exporter CrcB/FEX
MERSTAAAAVGGAITAIAAWVLQTWVIHQEIPPGIAAAFTTIVMAALTHFVPDSASKS